MRTTILCRSAAAFLSAAVAALGLVALAPVAQAAVPFDTSAAEASLDRLLPTQASQITLVAADPATAGVDSFTVSGTAGAVKVEGTSPATLLTGVGWYLRNVAHVDIGLPGTSTKRLPDVLPAVESPFTNSAVVPHRYALNDTDDGYSGAYRSFADYQHEIDVLALHGINEVQITVGAEKPYYDTMKQFGYSDAEMRSWIPAPAHQSWWLLQNMSGLGGPVSDQLVTARAAMGKKVCDLLRSLGMAPVLPGYYGSVPTDFATKNPGTNVVPQGSWSGLTRPSWLDPNDPAFSRVAAAYYAAQSAEFGNTTMYKMDPLHEGGRAGNVKVTAAATAIQKALLTAHPDAIWSILGWESNPSTAILNGVDKSKMLIVDGLSDRYNNLNRENSWGNTPYAFGTIPNFAGNLAIGANTGVWVSRFYEWLNKPGSMERGIAYLPEGTGTDPATFELFTDLAWSRGINQSSWFQDYSTARYGRADANAAAAWEALRKGPYSMPAGSFSMGNVGFHAARPSLTRPGVGGGSTPGGMRYDSTTVLRALHSLLEVAPPLRSTDAYKFDLVNTARQALGDRSHELLPRIKNAYDAKDLTTFRSLVTDWENDAALLDELMATDKRFLTGTWLKNVDSWGATADEQNQLQYDNRSIITTWTSSRSLNDYVAREYSGIMKDLYAKRWSAYFASLDTALVNNTTPAPVDFFAMSNTWARETTPYKSTATGHSYNVASAVADKLKLPPTGPITGIGGKCADVTDGNSAAGTPLQLSTCNGAAAQVWSVYGDGTLRAYGKCMDAQSGATTPGTTIQIWSCNGTPAQSWVYQADHSLKNVKSGLCLDAKDGSSADGTRLQLWTCNGAVAQQWDLPQ
ncbi:alpha-N-acetylglucosaminidase TIM-barrel domain-containing protein [Streptomyces sp. NPDC057580]|uniref:alpha-N-acetylglucosaminidase n=1 Tax=Streptomyces sp. NPDC057580 TaxID=3346173 RepID=UPI0036BC1197